MAMVQRVREAVECELVTEEANLVVQAMLSKMESTLRREEVLAS